MAFAYPTKQTDRETKTKELERNRINFVPEGKTELFCYASNMLSADDNTKKLRGRVEILDFLQEQSKSTSAFTLVAGYGNGTLHPLSLDQDLFTVILKTFNLPEKVHEVIYSIHGVFARFVESDDGDGDGPKSLLILLSTPKAPVREVFCTMRITPALNTVTCLLFDAQLTDLGRIIESVHNINRDNPARLSAWKTAFQFLLFLARELGHTSESKRHALDRSILGAEVQTKSTPWDDPSRALVRWPNDIHEATSVLHLCHNNLLFVARAVEFEIDLWRWLRRLVVGGDSKNEALLWLRGSDVRAGVWTALIDSIDFEMVHTMNKKTQIDCLKERIGVQINLINNLIAHQESSQTNLIAIVALVFAPASLIASIFSAGIFATDHRSWIAYVALTVPITILTVLTGVSFLEQQKLKHCLSFDVSSLIMT
ncbi:hypothetical protein UA08_07901 [Talaromyces atroroseus]|uniref:Uncharacterized protein n=1 Tax=Talaromyces atroroseus TaxID=1441469 RepID=A0A225A7U6_TALAT|nr:hypothetical protein UA08_07901 [Talaromyces atroroseus]OKL56761.1 hypothetical protein UA08_07901 [Talaromyces atroroseus]